mmetsp:Transcript_52001/g.139874  ORF Transcript_52001/g.139874 Transcript_52001/m.139874 type:complete len:213 (-) Transcript_52001:232-870(-)
MDPSSGSTATRCKSRRFSELRIESPNSATRPSDAQWYDVNSSREASERPLNAKRQSFASSLSQSGLKMQTRSSSTRIGVESVQGASPSDKDTAMALRISDTEASRRRCLCLLRAELPRAPPGRIFAPTTAPAVVASPSHHEGVGLMSSISQPPTVSHTFVRLPFVSAVMSLMTSRSTAAAAAFKDNICSATTRPSSGTMSWTESKKPCPTTE